MVFRRVPGQPGARSLIHSVIHGTVVHNHDRYRGVHGRKEAMAEQLCTVAQFDQRMAEQLCNGCLVWSKDG